MAKCPDLRYLKDGLSDPHTQRYGTREENSIVDIFHVKSIELYPTTTFLLFFRKVV